MSDILLNKVDIESLYKAGYRGAVMAPVDQNIDSIQDGFVSAKISSNEKKVRSLQQNRAIHKYASIIAEKFNDAGITKRVFFTAKKYESQWTGESFLTDVWRELQFALFKHRKTSKLTTDEVTKVYGHVHHFLFNNFSIDVPFPNNRDRGSNDAE